MSDEVIIVEPVIPVINVINQRPIVNVSTPGPQGPSQQIFYTHIQAIPSAVWTINHNLNGEPTAVVLDSAGTQCEGTFSYPSKNQMVITFTAAFSGTAYVV